MPRHRPRAKVLKFLQKINSNRRSAAVLHAILDDGDSDEDSVTEILDQYYVHMESIVSSSRYLFRNRRNRNRSTFFNWEDCLLPHSIRFNDEEFLHHFRMSRSGFNALLNLIKYDVVFQNKPGKMKKAPASHHLLVFLYRVGREGSSASDSAIATFFGIGKGSVKNYVRRVTKALNNLKSDVIKWPSGDDRQNLKTRIKVNYGFQKCIGIIDGTLIILDRRPTKYGDSYFCRKQCYAINVQVICDDAGRITYFYAGWPGSTHDNRAWRNCKVYNNGLLYFGDGEYLLGDSAYSACLYIVQSFKKVSGSNLTVHQEFFNTKLGRARVKSEHCIGILKNRFPCLKKMNIVIDGKRGVKEVMQIFTACAVMHNILLEMNDDIPQEWYDDIDSNHYWTNDSEGAALIPEDRGIHDAVTFDRRHSVFNAIIEDYYI